MAAYVNDAIWRRLSEYYNVTPRQAQVGDLYKRWLDEKNLNWGNAGDYFISQFPGVVNRGDAEWLFWTGGFGDNLVLLLDAAQERQTGTAPQWVLNRADTRVPSARVGSVGSAELRGVYHGLLLPGTVGNYASVPAAGVGNPGNSLDVRARVQMFATTGTADIVCKGFGVAAQAGWVLRQVGASMTCFVSTDGNNFSRTLSASHGLQIGDSAWFRFTYDGVTGRMVLFQAGDSDVEPDVWVTVASGVFTAGAVHASTQDVRVGVSGGNTNPFHGAVKRVVVRHTLGDGVPVLDTDFTAAAPFASSFTAGSGQTVTVTAASGVDSNDPTFLQHTGTNYLYLSGVTGNIATAPHSTIYDANNFDIRVLLRLDSTANAIVMSKRPPASRGNIDFRVASDALFLSWTDGTNFFDITSSAATLPTTSDIWIRATRSFDVSFNYTVVFYKSTDGLIWTTISTHTGAGVAAPATNTANLALGGFPEGATNGSFRLYRAQLINTGTSTTVFDADFTKGITNGNQTTFTESSTNAATITINRSSSGKKSVAVVRPVWLFGTNSYLEVVDSALLDFGANDSVTVISLARIWDTVGVGGNIMFAKTSSPASTPGYTFASSSNVRNLRMSINDSAAFATSTSPTATNGALVVFAGVVNRTTQQTVSYVDAIGGSAVSTSTVGSVANSGPFRVGSGTWTGAPFCDAEILAVAVIRRPLTATDLGAVRENFIPNPIVRVSGATTVETATHVVHTFASSGTFTVEGANLDVEYLVVAGGGAGQAYGNGGAGGGAGGLLTNMGTPTVFLPGTYNAVIGAGGVNASGSASSLGAISAVGGGRGGSGGAGLSGGSGGGGSNAAAGGAGTSLQGNAGGAGGASTATGGGGGGAGVAGSPGAATGNQIGGNGGDGATNLITGTSIYYAGGGGGGAGGGGGVVFASIGGLGGGGRGVYGATASPSAAAGDGTNGLGGGGGGSRLTTPGRGGNGIVIVRHLKNAATVIR